jgi:hypothetical protein
MQNQKQQTQHGQQQSHVIYQPPSQHRSLRSLASIHMFDCSILSSHFTAREQGGPDGPEERQHQFHLSTSISPPARYLYATHHWTINNIHHDLASGSWSSSYHPAPPQPHRIFDALHNADLSGEVQVGGVSVYHTPPTSQHTSEGDVERRSR